MSDINKTTPEMTEITPEMFGAGGEGATNDRHAWEAALADGRPVVGKGRYLIQGGDLVIPEGRRVRVGSRGSYTKKNYDRASGLVIDPTPVPSTEPGKVIEPSLLLSKRADFDGAVFRAGLVAPTNLRQALDGLEAWKGTAVKLVGSDVKLSLFVVGFHQGVDTNVQERFDIQHLTGDCINGLNLRNNYDTGKVHNVHWWPFYNAQLPWSVTQYSVSNVADNGTGGVRVTLAQTSPDPVASPEFAHTIANDDIITITGVVGAEVANGRWHVQVIDAANNIVDLREACTTLGVRGAVPTFAGAYTSGGIGFARAGLRLGIAARVADSDGPYGEGWGSFGWDIGLDLQGACNALQLYGAGGDNLHAAQDPYSIGIRIGGGAVACKLYGALLSSFGTAVLAQSASLERNTIYGAFIGGGASDALRIESGALALVGGRISDPIHVRRDAAALALDGVDIRLASWKFQDDLALGRVSLSNCRTIDRENRAFAAAGRRTVLGRIGIGGELHEGFTVEADGSLTARSAADAPVELNLRRPGSFVGTAAHLGAQLYDDAGALKTAARLLYGVKNATAAGFAGFLSVWTRSAGGGLTERWRIDDDGHAKWHGGAVVHGSGAGSPESSIKSSPGGFWQRTDPDRPSRTLYAKHAGTGTTGWVSQADTPAVTAFRTAGDLTVSPTSGWTPVVFNDVRVNTGGHYDPATGRFTCPYAGRYRVGADFLVLENGPDPAALIGTLLRNGVAAGPGTGRLFYEDKHPAKRGMAGFDIVLDCATGDRLEAAIAAFHLANAVNVRGTEVTRLTVEYLG